VSVCSIEVTVVAFVVDTVGIGGGVVVVVVGGGGGDGSGGGGGGGGGGGSGGGGGGGMLLSLSSLSSPSFLLLLLLPMQAPRPPASSAWVLSCRQHWRRLATGSSAETLPRSCTRGPVEGPVQTDRSECASQHQVWPQ
jgi:hypothetical protein